MLKQTVLTLTLTLLGTQVYAQPAGDYEVTITNITPGQTFTPQLVLTHPRDVSLFALGAAAGEGLEILAEGGNTSPLADELVNDAWYLDTVPGLLGPGQSVTTVVTTDRGHGYLSLAAMLIPTNDTFVALNGVPLPRNGTLSYMASAYDAGTEFNDQSCQHIPGPRCGGEGVSDAGGEGYVHIGNGFHQLGDYDEQGYEILGPQIYDWRNSVARITVTRKR